MKKKYSEAGKGDKVRPLQISQKQWELNYERIFRCQIKKLKVEKDKKDKKIKN